MQAALVPNPIWSTIDVAKESSRGRLRVRLIAPDTDKSLLNQIIVPVFIAPVKFLREKRKRNIVLGKKNFFVIFILNVSHKNRVL